MPILILETKVLILVTKKVDVTIIDIDTYYVTYKLKKTRVFAISIRNLEYQAKKKAKSKTNLRNIISKEYYDFLDIFSKKNSDTFPSY